MKWPNEMVLSIIIRGRRDENDLERTKVYLKALLSCIVKTEVKFCYRPLRNMSKSAVPYKLLVLASISV